MGDNLRQGQRGSLYIEAALDDLEIWRNRAQVFVCVAVCQIAEAQGLSYLSRGKQLLELLCASGGRPRGQQRWRRRLGEEGKEVCYLGRYVERAIRDVEVPNHEDEECHPVKRRS
jgi:hypothetical protein